MFEKSENKNEPDALDERIHGLRNGLRASARLKAAAIDGEWIAPAVRIRTHVWRFTKAVAAYALGVMLLLGVVAVLPGIRESDPVSSPGTNPANTALTDGTDFSALPDDLKAEIKEAYEKRNVNSKFGGWVEEGGSVHYYGTYNGCVVLFEFTDLYKVYELEVADSKFIFRSSYVLQVYQNGEFKDLPDAYEGGWLTKEDIAKIKVCYEQMLKENNG